MNLTTIIRSLIDAQKQQNTVATTLYTWNADANMQLGKLALPAAYLQLPTKMQLDVDSVTALEKGQFVVYYLTEQKRLQFDGVSNEAGIDAMMLAAVDLVGRIRGTHKVHIEEALTDLILVYDAGDRNLTGVKLTLKLKDLQGYCIPKYTREGDIL